MKAGIRWRKRLYKELLTNETISSIADAHGVSSAQVILRWDIQNGVIVMPGSFEPEHIKDNLTSSVSKLKVTMKWNR